MAVKCRNIQKPLLNISELEDAKSKVNYDEK